MIDFECGRLNMGRGLFFQLFQVCISRAHSRFYLVFIFRKILFHVGFVDQETRCSNRGKVDVEHKLRFVLHEHVRICIFIQNSVTRIKLFLTRTRKIE